MADTAPAQPTEAPTPDNPQLETHDAEPGVPAVSDEPKESKPAPAPKRKYKVKVEDKEEEVDEDELLRGYSHSKAANRKFQEAAELRKSVDAFVADAKKNPALLKDVLGVDLREWAEQQALAEIEERMLSPEEKELRDLRRFKESQDKTAVEQREAAEKAQREKDRTAAVETIDSEIFDALKEAGLKATPRTVARLAEQMLASLDEQGNRISGKDALKRARGDYQADLSELVDSLDPKQIAELFPSLLDKVRAHSLEAVKPALPTSGRAPAPSPTPAKKEQTFSEYMRSMRYGIKHEE